MLRDPLTRPFHDKFDERAAQYTSHRIALYNSANQQFPEARATERNLVIQRLQLEPGLSICDVAAGGGYLSDGIYQALDGKCSIVCIDNSPHFTASINPRFHALVSSLGKLKLECRTMDRIACLAGLHHQENKLDFFREAFRVLKPKGRLVVADALVDSPPAHFLNDSVHRYTDIGHDGSFFSHGQMTTLMQAAGFAAVHEQHCRYTWNFKDLETMVRFCKTLFRMSKATLGQVQDEIFKYLSIQVHAFGVGMEWSLTFATAIKPGE